MSSFTDYLEDAILQHVFMGVVYTPPTDIYVLLFTTMPDDDGTDGVEVTGGSYARQVSTFVASVTTGQIQTDAEIVFSTMPAATVVGAGLSDDPAAGNLLAIEALPVPITYTAGNNATIAAGALTFTLG